jgi:subtilisin-like proprotein convertase family protein
LGFVLNWQSDQGAASSKPFFVAVGSAQCESVAATDLPQAILDHGTTTSTLDILGSLEVESARVTVDISHSYQGDFWVELNSPSGTPVLLHGRTGGSANDIVGKYADEHDPNEPFPLTPYDPLSRVVGEPAPGSWSLEVRDGASGDQGSLQGFTLEICGRTLEATTPELRFRDVSADPGGVELSWWPYPGLASYRVYRSTDPAAAAAFIDVTGEDDNSTDTVFDDGSVDPLVFFLVTGVGPQGEGPKGHFGE